MRFTGPTINQCSILWSNFESWEPSQRSEVVLFRDFNKEMGSWWVDGWRFVVYTDLRLEDIYFWDVPDVQTPKYQTEAPPKHLNYSTIQLIGYANLFLFGGVGPPRKPDMWETKIATKPLVGHPKKGGLANKGLPKKCHLNSGLGIFQNYSNLPRLYIPTNPGPSLKYHWWSQSHSCNRILGEIPFLGHTWILRVWHFLLPFSYDDSETRFRMWSKHWRPFCNAFVWQHVLIQRWTRRARMDTWSSNIQTYCRIRCFEYL